MSSLNINTYISHNFQIVHHVCTFSVFFFACLLLFLQLILTFTTWFYVMFWILCVCVCVRVFHSVCLWSIYQNVNRMAFYILFHQMWVTKRNKLLCQHVKEDIEKKMWRGGAKVWHGKNEYTCEPKRHNFFALPSHDSWGSWLKKGFFQLKKTFVQH